MATLDARTRSRLLRKTTTTGDSVRRTTAMLETARATHRAAILAATEAGIPQREVARHLGVSEVTLREKLQRARVEKG